MIELDDFNIDCLNKDGYCQVSVPIEADNCTVLGYDVTSDNPMWMGLTWKDVMIDGGPDPHYGDKKYEYLHVSYEEEGGDEEDRLRYRVRPKLEIDEVIETSGRKIQVIQIDVAGCWGGKWHWRYHLKEAQ